jgi:hypothetical protein
MNIFGKSKNNLEDPGKILEEKIAPTRGAGDESMGDDPEQMNALVRTRIREDREQLQAAEVQQTQEDTKKLEALRKKMSKIIDIGTGDNFERKKENSPEQIRLVWQKFYQEVFGIETDFSEVEFPKDKEGFERAIIMAKGITTQQLIKKCREYFAVSDGVSKAIGEDLEGVIVSERSCMQESYAVLVQDLVEASRGKLEGFSADDAKAEKIATETLKERLIHELKYFLETGKHLDIESVTICAGSLLPSGEVPTVSSFKGNVLVVSKASNYSAGGYQPRPVIAKQVA